MRAVNSIVTLASAALLTTASPLEPRATKPQFSSAQVYGYVNDPKLNRDSIVSTRVGNREFWTSRDATNYDGQPGFFIPSTASWTNFKSDGVTPDTDSGNNLTTYGTNSGTYFYLDSAHCGPDGGCSDGSIYKAWPDSPPLPVNGTNGAVKLYSFIRNAHYSNNSFDNPSNQSCSLYRSDYDGSGSNALPKVTLLNNAFWVRGSIPYGNYGWVIGTDRFAYLYGQSAKGVVVARVDPAKIETGPYTYYSQATGWSSTSPSYTDANAPVPNCGTGQQGTFYYSSYFGLYIWIGGEMGNDSEFAITTAPNPWGPWDQPYVFYTAPPSQPANGLGYGYSWQAHPGLSTNQGNGKDIWLTYSRVNHYYENVLVKVLWK